MRNFIAAFLFLPLFVFAQERIDLNKTLFGIEYSFADSPFYQHEHLLRNVLTFFHKHPSLLYGFAEAYDIGDNSNIETFHSEERQDALIKVIRQYDRLVRSGKERPHGLLTLLSLFRDSTDPLTGMRTAYKHGWFEHYRFVNLEHLRSIGTETDPSTEGKRTVEFRIFRPPPTALHAEAMARLLVTIMDKLSVPGHLEKFEKISAAEFANFFTGSKIQSDWEKVKKLLEINDPLLDSMVDELVENIHSKKVLALLDKPGFELFESYSEKTKKGKVFELRTSVKENPEYPQVLIAGQFLEFEKVKIGKSFFWISVIDTLKLNLNTNDFRMRPNQYLNLRALKCSILFTG